MFDFNLRRETIAYLNADHERSKIHSPDLLLSKRPRNVDTLKSQETDTGQFHGQNGKSEIRVEKSRINPK